MIRKYVKWVNFENKMGLSVIKLCLNILFCNFLILIAFG